MRVQINTSSVSWLATTLLVWLSPLASGISVPTGKLEPISPARPQPRSINPRAPSAPAPVVEYTEDRPEPAPLDPSYKPYTFNYFNTLARHHIYWAPVRYHNFNAQGSNDIGYEPPQKQYFGQTLGKNTAYKSYKRQLPLPYLPVRPMDWGRQQWGSPTPAQPTPQYTTQFTTQDNNQNNGQANNGHNNEDALANNGYNNEGAQASSQYPGQYTVQPTQQQQQYEAVSTQSAPASTLTPQQPHQLTGKGSYDVTGKGGSRSEYYTKADWSKKAFPKKALDGTGKYGHKY